MEGSCASFVSVSPLFGLVGSDGPTSAYPRSWQIQGRRSRRATCHRVCNILPDVCRRQWLEMEETFEHGGREADGSRQALSLARPISRGHLYLST